MFESKLSPTLHTAVFFYYDSAVETSSQPRPECTMWLSSALQYNALQYIQQKLQWQRQNGLSVRKYRDTMLNTIIVDLELVENKEKYWIIPALNSKPIIYRTCYQ